MNDITQLTAQVQPGKTVVTKQSGEQPTTRQTHLAPPADIFENRQGVTLFADLPGVPREKLDVRVQDGILTVDAELVAPTPQGLQLRHGEVRHLHFPRTPVLNLDFDTSCIDARLRDGVLKLTISRRDGAKPRRIEVQAGRAYHRPSFYLAGGHTSCAPAFDTMPPGYGCLLLGDKDAECTRIYHADVDLPVTRADRHGPH